MWKVLYIIFKITSWKRPNTKPEDHGTLNAHNRWFILFYHVTHMKRNWLKWHLVEGPVTYDFTRHLSIRYHTTWFWRRVRTTSDTFLWALTISWSRLLARVWGGPNNRGCPKGSQKEESIVGDIHQCSCVVCQSHQIPTSQRTPPLEDPLSTYCHLQHEIIFIPCIIWPASQGS